MQNIFNTHKSWADWTAFFKEPGNREKYHEYQKDLACKLGEQRPCKANILNYLDRQMYGVLTAIEEFEWDIWIHESDYCLTHDIPVPSWKLYEGAD